MDQKHLQTCLCLSLGFLLFSTVSIAQQPVSQPIEVRDAQGRTAAIYNQSYALVIGVSNYHNGWPPLPGVRKDVDAIAAVLQQHGFTVEMVLDPDHNQLRAAYQNFVVKRGNNADNRLLLYYAGHGYTLDLSYGDSMGFLVPADAPLPLADRTAFRLSVMSMQEIETFARSIESKHALFVFDSCFAGSIFKVTRGAPEIIRLKTGKPVRQFITSGTAEQQVPDISIFRYRFVDALNGAADQDHDGYVTGTELGNYLQTVVTNMSRGTQTPQYGKLQDVILGQGDFVFDVENTVESEQSTGQQVPAVTNVAPRPTGESEELVFWNSIKDSQLAEEFEAYLQAYPNGRFAALAKLRAARLQQAQTVTQSAVSSLPANPQVATRAASNGFIFPDSDERRLRPQELTGLSKSQLRIARNEIFARKGRYFKSEDLSTYFSAFSWYQPFTWEPVLNAIEKANISLIEQIESR